MSVLKDYHCENHGIFEAWEPVCPMKHCKGALSVVSAFSPTPSGNFAIGVGGGGSNAVAYMHKQGIKGVDFYMGLKMNLSNFRGV